MTALLQLKDVEVSVEQRTGLVNKKVTRILSAINLSLGEGEIVAVVGESGCGKTTLGKVVTGLTLPSQGSLWFQGRVVTRADRSIRSPYRLGVQLIQQDSYAALNPAKTIGSSLGAPLLEHHLVRGRSQANNRIAELLHTVELDPPEQFWRKYPHQLSGGQRQRVIMARAISMNPRAIVADEPVSMIDVSLRLAILQLMARLNRQQQISFLYITHDLATARYLGQTGRLVVMYMGRIVEQGPMLQLLEKPTHPYLHALLAAVPIPDPVVAKNQSQLPLTSLEMSDLSNPPPGCTFHPRCPHADALCRATVPILRDIDGSHQVACHHAEEIPPWIVPRAT